MEEEQSKENILPSTKSINLMELFPRILSKEEKDFKITPSEYVKEMSLSMEERYKKSVHTTNNMKSSSKTYPSQFKIVPEVLVFQRFEVRTTNVLFLAVRNVGKSLLPIKMHCPSSDYFSARFANTPLMKIAPGLSVEYEITFTPKELKDQSHFLMFTSRDQSFRVPIIAIGPRPILDIPDQIVLNLAPVKIPTNKFIVIRNIGNAPAVFNFITQSKHFQVSPAKGILAVQESTVLNISFESPKVKEVTDFLYLALETGEKLTITLHGSAENVCVRLDKNSLVHEDTFMGLKRCKTIRLINSSSSVIKFSWKKHKTQEEELNIIKSMRDKYEDLVEMEILKDTKVIYYGLSSPEKHKLSCERILKDELRLLEKEEFKFTHEEFSIMPENGEVWPKGSVEIMVSFEPKTCGFITTEAYLEVSGKDSRLPLKIKGNGIGPYIVFNSKTFDIDFVYLCSLHKYEVIVENKGDIPGTIKYIPEPLVFGGKADVNPISNHLEPGHIGAFVISFTSNRLGDFTEKLNFVIQESEEKLYILLKGKVACPSLHFDVREINFGDVPFGFSKSQEITLNNLSMVPVLFSLKVKPDGDVPSISYEQFAKFTMKPALPISPKEFKMNPEESVVEPFSSKTVTVTLTPNKLGSFQKQLIADMWNSENGAASCPIVYQVLVAKVLSEPKTISNPFCFINCPYTRSIIIKNTSVVDGFFYIVPTDPNAKTPITCSVNIPQGIIQSEESIKIDLSVITSALGLQVFPLDMLIFGDETPQKICEITCIGQGPVVVIRPTNLSWGDLQLIHPSEKTVELSNESSIPAVVELQMVKQNSPWVVNLPNLNIPAGERVSAVISLTLNDRGKFKDNLKVHVHNGKDILVPVTANGVGSSLIMKPNLNPCYDLGMLSSHKAYEFEIIIDNKGTKLNSLVWSPFADHKAFVNAKFVYPQELMFKFEPAKVDIQAGEQATVILQTSSKLAGKFSQPFYCFSSVGSGNKTLFFKFEVRAEFSEPVVCFDKTEVRFWHNMGYNELEAKLNDNICVINNSLLPIQIELATTGLFYIETPLGECSQTLQMYLDGMEVKPLVLKFLSQPNPNKVCKTYKGKLTAVLTGFSKSNTACLIGEVNYPNVIVRPNNINFGYIIAGRNYSKAISLINISPLTVHFSIKWDIRSSKTQCSHKVPCDEPQATEESCEETDENAECDFEELPEEEKRQEEEGNDNIADEKSQLSLSAPEKPVLKMPEIQVSSTEIRKALFPLTRTYFGCDNELMEAYRLASSFDAEYPACDESFPKVCDIIPFYGELEPYSWQILTVRFFTKFALSAHLTALIHVMCGPTEVITIDAITTEIDIELNSTELDFGRQLFCETTSQTLKLYNSSSMTLPFETNSGSKCTGNDKSGLERGLMTVSPETGNMLPYQSTELIVQYHPGVPGKFENYLELQIAFLEPAVVKLTGIGVFPQVYVTLLRPDIFTVPPDICYKAIAGLTPDWILTKFFQTGPYGFDPVNTCRSQDLQLDLSEENDWEILDSFDCIPTEIDIYLAIERGIAHDSLQQENSAAYAVYGRTIPGFVVPAYTLDFGVCMIGQYYEQQVVVVNYGPLPVILYGVFSSKLKEEGITIRLKKRNELKIGACLPFIVSFEPKKSKYNHIQNEPKCEKLDIVFHFEVYHGPKIPVRIISVVSYPFVVASMSSMQFCEVVCGCCKIIDLKLYNPGVLPTLWNAFIQLDDENAMYINSPRVKCQKTMFHVHQKTGALSPGDYTTLRVSFKPESEGCFSGILRIAVNKSLTDLKILLFGTGIEPRLCISKPTLNFKPILPFPNKSVLTEKIFSVENPCMFPIEFYFADLDEQVREEEKIIRALTLYYDTDECLIPVRRPGEGLQAEIIDFYNMLLDNLNTKYVEEERGKILAERERESLEENMSASLFPEDDPLSGTNQAVERRKKKFKKPSRSRTSVESGRDLTGSMTSVREPIVLSMFETKTADEIDEMLEDYIKCIRNTEPRYDPLKDVLKKVMEPPKEEEYKEGTLIIIHGAPYTNSLQLANRVASFLDMPALNIDRIVLEEAALERCSAGYMAKEFIERAYLEQFGVEVKENEEERNEEEEGEVVQPTFEENFEEIQRKFMALKDLRENLSSARGMNIRTPSTKSATPKKAEKDRMTYKPQMNVNAPIANITEDMVTEILNYRLGLEVCKGVVIEKLESTLITNCTNALTTVLKAAGNVKDIIVIFFLTNYISYQRLLTKKQEEEELANLLLQQEMLRVLEEEPEEVLEAFKLPPEKAELYRTTFIAERLEALAKFEKKRDEFYESLRQKKKGTRAAVMPSNAPLLSTPLAGKKTKEGENTSKNTKTSDRSGRKPQSEPKSGKLKPDSAELEFLSFETSFIEMKRVIENWDQRIGATVTNESQQDIRTRKGQTPRRVSSALVNKEDNPRGIFLWLVDVSKPLNQNILACCSHLKEILEERKPPEEFESWPLESTKSMTFSVLSAPQKRVRCPLNQIFTITASDNVMMGEDYCEDMGESKAPPTLVNAKLNRSVSSISFKSKRKGSGFSKRGRSDSRMSIDVRSKKAVSSAGALENQFKTRWILQPGETQHYMVRYCPTQVGCWEQHYVISIVNYSQEYVIRCFGDCDIPRLDMNPEILFCCVEYEKPLQKEFVPAYYYSEKAYDFGAVITTHLNEEKKSSEKSVSITLNNISNLPVDLNVILGESKTTDEASGSEFVTISPEKLWINPRECKILTVTVSPTRNGFFLETLLFIVKDNPKVESLQIKFEGAKSKVSLQPELLDFDRILLHRTDYRNMILINENTLPLYFVLTGIEQLPDHLNFSQICGIIQPLEYTSIEVSYKAVEVEVIDRKPVLVKIFDDPEENNIVQELTLEIKAEAYDAALDIIFSAPDDDHIDFGDIRMDTNYGNEFSLKNSGKYQLSFKIVIEQRFLNEIEFLLITPMEGKLIPGKLQPITTTIKLQHEVSWHRLEFFKIHLLEPFHADENIAAIPLSLTVRSHFARFKLQPPDQYNFGHIILGQSKSGTLQLTNTGFFPLTFFVEAINPLLPTETTVDTKKSSKFSASSKEKTEKGKKIDVVLKIGNFEISPCAGTVEPGLIVPINITCFPSEVKSYEEKVAVYANESSPDLQKGKLMTISAESCLPFVDFQDYKNIFREHFCCEDESELNARCKVGSYTIYTVNNNLFSFKNVCVNKKTEGRLHFQNPGPVDCVLTAVVSLQPEEGKANGGLPSDDSQYFTVSPEKHIIEAYNSACFVVAFTPDALEVYEVQLTFTLERPEGFDDVIQVYNFRGNGILPQIEITEPSLKTPEGQTLVNFPPVSPGRTCRSTIAFTNVGITDCKVVMEMFRFQNGIFTITPKSGSESTLKAWELAKAIDHTALVSLAPGQVAEFYVTFAPPEVQNYNSLIKLFVVDNPFENWCFKLSGEVFLEEVIIEKIRTATPFLTNTDDNSLGVISLNQYAINLGDCYVKKKSKVVFRLTNRTNKNYFKFEWEEVPSVSVTPNVGHLYPNSYKEILVVFCPEEPMDMDDITLTCLLTKIILKPPPELSWDSRISQNDKNSDSSSFTPRTHDKNSSVVVVTDEPLHEVIPESSRTLYMIMSAVADYTRLTCETTKIVFKETFMFQTRKYPLVLINSGNVALEYKVSLKSVTSLPLKENKSAQVTESSIHQSNSRPLSRWSSSVGSQRRRRGSCESPKGFLILDLSSCNCESEESSPHEEPPESNFVGYNPFSIENPMGRIVARGEATVNVVFSPMDINEYKTILTIQVANLHPECELPEIQVTATSIMPFCHFEVSESDYLKSGRRDHNRPGPVGFAPGVPLHPETKAIETKVVGLDVVTPIKFHVINPTEDDYSFSWTNTTQIQPGVVSPFLCSTTDGQIQAGRQQLMAFKFVSQNIGIAESFWTFSIPKFGVETPFLFIGDVREPAVYLLSNHLSMMPTFINCTTSDTVSLASQEDEPVDFHFIGDSLYSEGRLNILEVDTPSGTIPPHSEFTVRLRFTGKTAGKTLFNVKCKIKNMKNPLTISVEVVTFAVQYILTLENSTGKSHPEFNERNLLEFGNEMSTNVPETMTLTIMNYAKTPLYYDWEYNLDLLEARPCKLKFSPKSGHIEPSQKEICEISLVFLKKSSLRDFPVMLKLRLGPTINFFVSGTAAVPHWEFSFSYYDFGFCFLQEKDICFNRTLLLITNRDAADLILECDLPDSSAFGYTLENTVIHPCESLKIPITFHPKEIIHYEDVLKLTINGNQTRNITLMGHGTEFKVTLVNAEDKTISLGAVREGHMSLRKFSILNKSLAEATLLIGFPDQLPVSGENLAQPEKYFVDLTTSHRLSEIITISPSSVFKIKPQEEQTISVTYSPCQRAPPFSETIYLQHQETAEPLCVLTGCCLGPHFWLDRNFLNFGGIIEGCTTCLKLKLVNSGDFGARFDWEVQGLKEYSITPASGYSSPQSHVTISVTFHPSQIQSCIKESVLCQLYLSNTEYCAPLYLNLIGDCVALPDPQEIIWFECEVRKTAVQIVQIENPSGSDWQLLPVVTGEYFTGEETLMVSALSSADYQVYYNPMMMTSNEETHQGTVFFKLPNGRAIVYMMKAIALPPEPEEMIEREVPCKTKYVELLKVRNWLQYPQRFKVDVICVENCDSVTSCTGFEYLEVPGLAQKEYSLNFFAYNVGFYKYNVKFENEETKEYILYVIGFNVGMCGPLEVITLKSGVRQTCTHELKLENPLKKTIEYELETTTPEIYFDSPTYEVPPEQSVYVVLSFTPIHPGEKNEKLTASCPELGIFPRELRLFAAEVLPEPPRTFETSLGTSIAQEFSITNHSWENAVLHCKVDSDNFTVAEQAVVPEGQTKKITVTYEPSDIGSTTATLFVESKEAGKFIFPLVGMCTKPLAKGPFNLKPGSGVTIIFKNVFNKPKEFHLHVDNPAFILKTSQETLSPKEESKIFVGMQKMKYLQKEYGGEWELKPNFPVAGQLIVECFNPYVRWQFYLKGDLES